MKRKEETAIILSALATAGVPESNQVKSAVDYGLKLIRIRKFEERTEPKEGLPMLEKWTGDLIGKMHNSKVTYDEVAAELGCTKTYVSMILNGRRKPPDARKRLESAVSAVIQRKKETKT
nr:MAG TPA: antitoxin [Caudoviricetes sp.]